MAYQGGKNKKGWLAYTGLIVLLCGLSMGLLQFSIVLFDIQSSYQQIIVFYVYIGLLILAILLYVSLVSSKRQRQRVHKLELEVRRYIIKDQRNKDLTSQIDNLNSELTDIEKRHKQSQKRLKELDNSKDDFVSMASHQLRTPLTSIKGYLSMVLDGDVGKISPKQREMLSQAYISSQRMVYIIADLLNVSRLQSGKFFIERSPVILSQILEEELEPLYKIASSKKIDINYEAPVFCPPLMLDDSKIRQVIMNFIDNAIYYTPEGGTIDLKLDISSRMIRFEVRDNGIGVPIGDRPKLFTKFYRSKNARKMRPDGTGIGLFIAKKAIIAQGGSIVFRSTEGKGSTFGFSFPLVRQ